MTTKVRSGDISCGGCTATIEKALSAVPGIEHVDGDPATKVVTVLHDESVTLATILAKMDEAGFSADPI